ncbi:MAG: RsmD family RNA methyltransferase [Deltaproteobacteria bacterium]|nr:RsmD family RNA methyltransferase [Deltaproteobacteria bacterium]
MLQGVAHISDLRPLTSRALKSSIDRLRPWLAQSHVLDLYCGKGRFGLATLREEIASVTFVDNDATLIKQLRHATAKTAIPREFFAIDAFKYLERAIKEGRLFDIIFADPPFRLWISNFPQRLHKTIAPILNPEGFFLVKCPKRMVPSPDVREDEPRLWLWKESVFGESKLLYYRHDKSK